MSAAPVVLASQPMMDGSMNESEAAEYLRGVPPEEWERALMRLRLLSVPEGGRPGPSPMTFDFDASPEPPDWIVHGLIERGTVTMLSGDTGAAKSIVTASVIADALQGREWLGHWTKIERVMVVDEENPERIVRSRLAGLGMSNDARDRLRYFNREGIALGADNEWTAWLHRTLAEFRPDLLVIDTLMAACAVADANSNDEAARTMKWLRGIAREYQVAVLVLHHERKRSKDHPASSGQSMMGARQWAGQADSQLTLTVESDLIETDAEAPDHRRLRRTFKWRPAEKDRDGRPNIPRRLAVESEKDATGGLLWMRVSDEGPATDDAAHDTAETAILAALMAAEGEGWMPRQAIARAVGEPNPKQPGGTFLRALDTLRESEKTENKPGGKYRITDHGRATASLAV